MLQEENLFTGKTGLKFNIKSSKCYILSTVLYGAENWTSQRGDQKYLGKFEMWCWRRMQKTSWADRVRYKEVYSQGGK